jgi:lysophospholipase L1-like esterase
MKRALLITSIMLNVGLMILCLLIINVLGSLLLSMPERVNDQYNALSEQTAEVVFVGDSLTFGGNWHEWFPDVDIVNRGIGGDTTQMLIDRFEQVIKLKPTKIFLMIGVNDLNKRLGTTVATSNYEKLFNLIDTQLPDTIVYVQSVLPVNNDWLFIGNADIGILNVALKKNAEARGYVYIDLNSKFSDSDGLLFNKLSNDGIHLLGEGYSLWRKQIEDYVDE